METNTREIKSIVMFDFVRKGIDNTFTVFITASFKDYDVVYNTIVSIAKIMGSNYIRTVIDNTVYFIDCLSNKQNSVISEEVGRIIFEEVNKGITEIWI